jgi:cob(I)alamin adenosyltransferase
MKIYTKKGDKGETGLADGKRYSKSEEIFWLMGEVDELIAWMGVIQAKIQISRSQDPKDKNPKTLKLENPKNLVNENLKKVQRNLFAINAILARAKNVKFDSKKETEWLEKEIDKMTAELPELRNFILPGESEISAFLHVARAICRRVERRLVMCQHGTMMEQKSVQEILPYFNRLSDYLFTLARLTNFKLGEKEEIWKG